MCSSDRELHNLNNVISIQEWAEAAAFGVIFAATFGSDVEPGKEVLQEFQEAFAMSSSPHARTEMAIETILPATVFSGLLPLDEIRRTRTSMKEIRRCCQGQIDKRRGESVDPSREKADNTILGTAMKTNSLSDEDLLETCTSFLTAGYKTVSAAVVWAIFFLSTRPGLQAMLRTEIRANITSPDTTKKSPLVTASKLKDLKLLTAVCSETLRLTPPVHTFYREARTDMFLSGSGTVVPTGTILTISPWVLHQSPIYWKGSNSLEKPSSASHMTYPDPKSFDPTRWLSNKDGGARMTYSYMPYGRGPRCCIAESFAQNEMAILVAALIGRFDFSFKSSGNDGNPNSEALRISFGVTAMPVRLMVQAQPVEGW